MSSTLLHSPLRNETEIIDPNIIIIDPTVLLNTDIDNIRLEFNKLLKNLREKTKEGPVTDMKAVNGLCNNDYLHEHLLYWYHLSVILWV